MRELSLHLLDLIENSIRACATSIGVCVHIDPEHDLLRIIVEDNGAGLKVAPDNAADPFYTTKSGKRTGLGLSLFRAAAEQAGGRMTLVTAASGGVLVTAELQLSHVDRNPLGDLAGTLASVVLTSPEIDFRLDLRVGERACTIRPHELPGGERSDGGDSLSRARRVAELIQAALLPAKELSGVTL